MFYQIIWLIVIGLTVAFLAQILISASARANHNWQLFLTAILGSLFIGLFIPMDSIFLAPFIFWGTLLMSLLGSLLFVWLTGILILLLNPTKTK